MRARGFTLLGLLFLVAGLGIALAAIGTLWQTASKREKEKELLYIGAQFRQALESYQRVTPDGQPPFPEKLEELLLDPRQSNTVRHLRKIFTDPMTGSTEWGLIRIDGRIHGVHSQSRAKPLKTAVFSGANTNFMGKIEYADWVFQAANEQPPKNLQRSDDDSRD